MGLSAPTRLQQPSSAAWTRSYGGWRAGGSGPAYGTETIPKVDKITGPGNAFVAAAKQMRLGDIGIDMIAGPSEVCVLADASARTPGCCGRPYGAGRARPAGSLLPGYLRRRFCRPGRGAVSRSWWRSRPCAEITRASLSTNEGTIVVAADMAAAVEAVNYRGAGALELHCKGRYGAAGRHSQRGRHLCGRVGVPSRLGDYVAGPNHTLPTGGTAFSPTRFRSRSSSSARASFAIRPGPDERRACHPALAEAEACGPTRFLLPCVVAFWSRARMP